MSSGPGAGDPASPSEAVRLLLVACIAGDAFRQAEQVGIRRALEQAPTRELAVALNATHTGALFDACLGHLVSDAGLKYELACATTSQGVYNGFLGSTLATLVRGLPELAQPPVILKGPGFWSWLYPDIATRKTRDLDLLIRDPRDLEPVVTSLQDAGFRFEHPVSDLAADDHYELPTLFREDLLSVTEEEAERIDHLLELCPSRPDFERVGPGEYTFRIEIEIHKGLFLLLDGTVPLVSDAVIRPSEAAPGLMRLALPAQIPYAAAKFGMDTEGAEGGPPQAQSLKLLGDFVRLMERLTPAEAAESVLLARAWGCGGYYGRTVATARPLLPDIAFRGVTADPYDLNTLFDLASA